MDVKLRLEIQDFYDDAMKKFYPDTQRDEIQANFRLYDKLTEEGYVLDFSNLQKGKG